MDHPFDRRPVDPPGRLPRWIRWAAVEVGIVGVSLILFCHWSHSDVH